MPPVRALLLLKPWATHILLFFVFSPRPLSLLSLSAIPTTRTRLTISGLSSTSFSSALSSSSTSSSPRSKLALCTSSAVLLPAALPRPPVKTASSGRKMFVVRNADASSNTVRGFLNGTLART
ncbi:hypothetical protein FA13DRAFT_1724724 [Coprinellus micaceus]|uniref:Uncharacterized protein n=1 Tax=Coprinellus micaceus TaxID=71717 RepID=A0A4Y7TX77_COPMI|nr:hypothetical protein FA13DRAFT_1724724 [Coprinellus micaceus]